MVKRLPTMQETQVRSLCQEDPLEKEIAAHSPILMPGKPHGPRSLTGYSPWGHKRVGHDLGTKQQNIPLVKNIHIYMPYLLYPFIC